MKTALQKLRRVLNTKLGFFLLVVLLFCLKSYWAYQNEFNLGVKGSMQQFLLAFNTIPSALVFLGIALYFRGRLSYWMMLIINAALSTWLFANILYYREFSDFITFNVIKGSGAASNNLGKSLMGILRPEDFLVYLDVVILALILLFHFVRVDMRRFKVRYAMTITALGFVLFGVNLGMAESDRSQLLTRTFDNNYIVKYLGLEAYTVYDGVKTTNNSVVKARANRDELKPVLHFIHSNYAAPNVEYYGKAKGKNIFIIHLESLQQFMIDYKQDGQEVMPNLNKLYHANDTLAFDNFFHQVGQGKTSDAENMLETSTFGLPQGSLFATLGSDNTFQGAPAILNQRAGYTSAVFHGNVASFWNRNNVYKNLGYQYFFDASYYDTSGDKATGYGLKDKLLFKNSVNYLQNLQQPFYTKFITVTNHFPYSLDDEDKDPNFQTTNTGNTTVDNYFVTAHYLDQSLAEFFAYLQKTGLDKNSVIMIYGDHYGISNSENKALATALDRNPDDWTDFDNTQLQRVPLMFVIPGSGGHGGIYHQYGGEVDVLPTLLHLLGISTKRYIQFGTDLFSSQHSQVVAFRNHDFVTPRFSSINGTIYDNKTGKIAKLTAKQKKQLKKNRKLVNTELSLSDSLNEKNLLRFYHPKGFKKVNPADYNYSNGLKREKQIEKKLGDKSTSIFSKNGDRSTVDDYSTDAPEQNHSSTDSNRIKITNPDGNNK